MKVKYVRIIKQKLLIIIIFAIVIALVFFSILAHKRDIMFIDKKTVFILFAFVYLLLTYLFIQKFKKYNKAKLIIDNEILSIKIVEFDSNPKDSIEFIISCFGILLGEKIVMFNTDGIKLKEINITKDTLNIIYGKEKKIKNIRLFHKISDKEQLNKILEKFHYETGIIPNIVDF